MIPQSTPSGPQHGPGQQPYPETQQDTGIQLFPDLQDGPDPSPPLKASAGSPVRKRVIKPSAPEHRPHPSGGQAPVPHASPSQAGDSPQSLPRQQQSPHAEPANLRNGKHTRSRVPGDPSPAGRGIPASQSPDRPALPVDLIRRTAVSAVTAAVAVCTVSAIVRANAGNQAPAFDPNAVLSPAGSLMAPAATVWWLWLPIVAGWLAYALYQWLPRQRTNPRHIWLGWLILAAEILALGWLLAAVTGTATGMLIVGAVQTALGLLSIARINTNQAPIRGDGFLTDVPLGMFLAVGVFTLSTALAFLLTHSEADLAGWGGEIWACIALITVTVGINIACMTDRGHLALALPAVWALGCVAAERFTGTPESAVVGAAAAAGAFLVLVSAGSRRHQVDHERRRNERRLQP